MKSQQIKNLQFFLLIPQIRVNLVYLLLACHWSLKIVILNGNSKPQSSHLHTPPPPPPPPSPPLSSP